MLRRTSRALAFIIMSGLILAQAQTATEYQLKAAFIYRFPKFIEWPTLPGADPNGPIVIGILGEDPFGQEIEAATDGQTANGRRLVVRRFPNLRQLTRCHILFVSSSEKNNLSQIFAAVAASSVLTLGETNRFAEAGGIIQLNMVAGKVKLIINQAAAERAGLKISATVLRLAEVIRK